MAYPELPWKLKGDEPLFGGLFLSDIKDLNGIVPERFKMVKVLPGKTIGSYYYCRFGKGSEVEYNELVLCPALVRYKFKIGFYGQIMYVDNPFATVDIYERAGIPKELADFHHDREAGIITVTKNDTKVCNLQYREKNSYNLKRKTFNLFGFGFYDNKIIRMRAPFTGELKRANVNLYVNNEGLLDASYIRKEFMGIQLNNWNAELFHTLGVY